MYIYIYIYRERERERFVFLEVKRLWENASASPLGQLPLKIHDDFLRC